MFARLRCLGTGAVLGLGLGKAAKMLSEKLDEDPEAVREALGPIATKLFPSAIKEPGEAANLSNDPAAEVKKPNVVALVRMSGTIAATNGSALGDASKINLSKYDEQLKRAFRTPNVAAVAIEINSPGGSPVQSALLYNRLRALKQERPDVPLLCFCTDVCASGGYYIAAACDEIHVLPSTIIGSIGVVAPSVGFVDLLKSYGIEDRTLTAGTSKVGDSPLQPRNPVGVAQKRMLLEELHVDFKASVSATRGQKLKHSEAAAYARKCGDRKSRAAAREALFDGSVYAGRTAVQFGLADEIYDEMGSSLKRRFGSNVKVRELKSKQGVIEKLQALQEAGASAHAAAMWREARFELSRAAIRERGAAGLVDDIG